MGTSSRSRVLLSGAIYTALAFVLLWSRLTGLDLSFWHDEVVTVTRYAGQGPHVIFFSDYIPNNHVLFEILAWATTTVFGSSEVTYRLWGLLPALGATAWLTWWAFRRFGHLVGVTVALLLVVSPLLFQLSREARGYGLAMLAMAGLITQADSALRSPEGGAVWRFAFFGLLGVLTLPAFVLPYLFAALPLLLDSRIRSRLVLAVSASGVLALVWFFPMLLEILEHSSQEFGRPVPWHGFITLSMLNLVFPTFRLLMPGIPDILLGSPRDSSLVVVVWHAVAWVLIILGGLWLWRKRNRVLLYSLASPAIGTYLVMAGFGMWVVDRFVSYLSLPVFVLLALGVKELIDLIPAKARPVVRLGIAGLASWLLVSFIPLADYVVHVPHEAMKNASQVANASGTGLVLTNSGRPEGLVYYLDSAPQIMSAPDLERMFCGEDSATYVFIELYFRSEEVDTSCLEARDTPRISLKQRGRGRHIDVWLVGVP
jgi:hypothetical protein